MKDMGEVYYVIGIEIFCDRSQELLGLSQKAYINKVLERFKMDKCLSSLVPTQKEEKFSLMQSSNNDLERKQMEDITYAFVVGSLMYAQTCTRPDINFIVDMLGRYQSNSEVLESCKESFKIPTRNKESHAYFRKFNHLEVISYTESIFVGCPNTRKFTFGYVAFSRRSNFM